MLIKCTECNHDISDKAAACPNCGAPVETVKQEKQVRLKPLASDPWSDSPTLTVTGGDYGAGQSVSLHSLIEFNEIQRVKVSTKDARRFCIGTMIIAVIAFVIIGAFLIGALGGVIGLIAGVAVAFIGERLLEAEVTFADGSEVFVTGSDPAIKELADWRNLGKSIEQERRARSKGATEERPVPPQKVSSFPIKGAATIAVFVVAIAVALYFGSNPPAITTAQSTPAEVKQEIVILTPEQINAETARILAELRTIPASEYQQNYDRYMQLLEWHPDNERYLQKAAHYQNRLDLEKAKNEKRRGNVNWAKLNERIDTSALHPDPVELGMLIVDDVYGVVDSMGLDGAYTNRQM